VANRPETLLAISVTTAQDHALASRTSFSLIDTCDKPKLRHKGAAMFSTIEIHLPSWLPAFAQSYVPTIDILARMEFIVAVAQENVKHGTGGPFAAGIFRIDNGELVGIGVNLVTTENLSILHAEMVAFITAQRALGSYDLGGSGMAAHELVTSAEPCAMCFGAIPWSGVRRVVCGARREDAEQIGFDEGPKSLNWVSDLQQRGIAVMSDVGRSDAVRVLAEYSQHGGAIYNSREGLK
jgi:tRNA(Arg) A34 adenosine deaminase TadA